MKHRYCTCEIEGLYPVRFTDAYMVINMEYDHDGYLNVNHIDACPGPDHKGRMRRMSDRFTLKYQEANWDFLYEKCMQESDNRAEYLRDMQNDYGDYIYHLRKEEAA